MGEVVHLDVSGARRSRIAELIAQGAVLDFSKNNENFLSQTSFDCDVLIPMLCRCRGKKCFGREYDGCHRRLHIIKND